MPQRGWLSAKAARVAIAPGSTSTSGFEAATNGAHVAATPALRVVITKRSDAGRANQSWSTPRTLRTSPSAATTSGTSTFAVGATGCQSSAYVFLLTDSYPYTGPCVAADERAGGEHPLPPLLPDAS